MEKYLDSFENRRLICLEKKNDLLWSKGLLFFVQSQFSLTSFSVKLHELLEQMIFTIIV